METSVVSLCFGISSRSDDANLGVMAHEICVSVCQSMSLELLLGHLEHSHIIFSITGLLGSKLFPSSYLDQQSASTLFFRP